MKHLAICGMTGAGKSYLVKKFSELNDIPFVDIDTEVEKRENKDIFLIFDEKGEAYFRRCELEIIGERLLSKEKSLIALGAGSIMNVINRERLKTYAITIYLETDMEVLLARLKNDTKRPLLNNAESVSINLNKLLNERKNIYLESDYIIKNKSLKNNLNRLNWIWNEHIND